LFVAYCDTSNFVRVVRIADQDIIYSSE